MIDYNIKSLQYVFNKVAKGLLTQRKKCKANGSFVLINSEGLRCAYGHLFSKRELYKKLKLSEPFFAVDTLTPQQTDLMDECMECHDGLHPNQWKNCLRAVAKEYNLQFKFEDLK